MIIISLLIFFARLLALAPFSFSIFHTTNNREVFFVEFQFFFIYLRYKFLLFVIIFHGCARDSLN